MRLIKLLLPVIVLFGLHEKIIAQDTTKLAKDTTKPVKDTASMMKDTTNLMNQLENEGGIKLCILPLHLSTPELLMAIR